MSDYRIEKVAPENFSMLVPLMKNCFGMNVNIEYFIWKYLKNPSGNFIGFVAIQNDTNEVAAYYGVIPETYSLDGKQTIIYQSCDTMTHSEHRRKGLFQKLALHCYDYIKSNHIFFIIGFGGIDSMPGLLKFGWKYIFNFKYYFKPALLCKIESLLYSNSNCISELDNVQELNSFFVTSNFNKIFSIKNVSHFNWRISNPRFNYKILSYKKQDIIEGYLVYYIQENKLILFDFEFITLDAKKYLLRNISKIVIENKLRGAIAFCQEKNKQSNILLSQCFITNVFNFGPLNEKVPFTFFSDNATLLKYKNSSDWLITAYDHDSL